MCRKSKTLKVAGSNFNRNEKFGLNSVPKHFESVTDEEVKRIKTLVMEEIEKTSQFKPGALSDTLKSVDGHFESAYSTLEGDYGTRLSNLDEVYTRSLTKIRRAYDAYILQVAEYNILFEKYLEASRAMDDKELPQNLAVADDSIFELKQIIKELDEGSRKNG